MPITAPETSGMRIHTNANATDRKVILSMEFTDTSEDMRVSLQPVLKNRFGETTVKSE
jgi:hypothetical protein